MNKRLQFPVTLLIFPTAIPIYYSFLPWTTSLLFFKLLYINTLTSKAVQPLCSDHWLIFVPTIDLCNCVQWLFFSRPFYLLSLAPVSCSCFFAFLNPNNFPITMYSLFLIYNLLLIFQWIVTDFLDKWDEWSSAL